MRFWDWLGDEGKTLRVRDDKGDTVICDVLFTFDSTDTGKHYIVYTDWSKDAFGATSVYASIVAEPSGEDDAKRSRELLPIETEGEWETIEKILSKFQDEARAATGSGAAE